MAGVLTAVFAISRPKSAVVNPQKLAAYELQMKTETGSPASIGRVLATKRLARSKGAVEIPKLLSIPQLVIAMVARRVFDATPRRDWPPLVNHLLFDIKMATAIIALAISLDCCCLQLHFISAALAFATGHHVEALYPGGYYALATVELVMRLR